MPKTTINPGIACRISHQPTGNEAHVLLYDEGRNRSLLLRLTANSKSVGCRAGLYESHQRAFMESDAVMVRNKGLGSMAQTLDESVFNAPVDLDTDDIENLRDRVEEAVKRVSDFLTEARSKSANDGFREQELSSQALKKIAVNVADFIAKDTLSVATSMAKAAKESIDFEKDYPGLLEGAW